VSSNLGGVAEVRRRLTPEKRRDELLDVGAELFVDLPYEEVLMEEVALRAGVSRGLMYHYFPSKSAFFAAIFKRDSDRLLEVSQLDAGLPLADQVLTGLDAHLDYFAAHKKNILTANRGALSGDPTVQGIISDQLATLRDRMLQSLGPQGHARTLTAVALDGWLAFVRAVCVEWLEGAELSRGEVRAMCFRALAGIFVDQVDLGATGAA
jgi:AcrR family transcriptional regulator